MNASRVRLVSAVVLAVGFLAVFATVYLELLLFLDVSLFKTLNGLAALQLVTVLAIVLGFFGDEFILIPFALLLYFLSRTNRLEITSVTFFAVLVADIVVLVVKTLYFRPRPFQSLTGVILPLGPDSQSSFPSGHVTRAFAVAVFLGLRKHGEYWLLLIPAVGVAFSRILVGVHYPLDVLGGVILGSLIGLVSLKIGPQTVRRLVYRFFSPVKRLGLANKSDD